MVTKGLTGHADGETYIIHAAGADRSAVRHTVGVKRRVAGVTRTRAYGVQVSGRVHCRNRVIRCRYVTVILERFSRSKLGIVSKNNRTILYNNTIRENREKMLASLSELCFQYQSCCNIL